MRKLIATTFLISAMFITFDALSGVRFIVDSPTHTKRDKIVSPSVPPAIKHCIAAGYTKATCALNEEAVDFCPYNHSYFKYCCPSGQIYTKKQCDEKGMAIGKSSCHGYYRCE